MLIVTCGDNITIREVWKFKIFIELLHENFFVVWIHNTLVKRYNDANKDEADGPTGKSML